MPISEFELKRCKVKLSAFMAKHRPPVHIRAEVDLDYKIENQSVSIFEIRPQWDNPTKKTEIPIAKATYIKKHKLWKVYWHRADLKWHSYEPQPTVKMFEEFLDIVGEDQHACFFG
ncbi:MAG: DUF3024 domain-containing protein [Ghiorsea sp.]|nr:DUF3024 domain-containing protein [Ghiorsea sp.]MDQ7057838.1 DUF3024 domain-containing protein [Ghiorsea sp.]